MKNKLSEITSEKISKKMNLWMIKIMIEIFIQAKEEEVTVKTSEKVNNRPKVTDTTSKVEKISMEKLK
jgi:hypothetical protein